MHSGSSGDSDSDKNARERKRESESLRGREREKRRDTWNQMAGNLIIIQYRESHKVSRRYKKYQKPEAH